MTQGITVKVSIDSLSMDLINQLDEACKAHKGKHRLRMELLDRTKRLKLTMAAKERKVNATNGFIAELEKLGVDYKLN